MKYPSATNRVAESLRRCSFCILRRARLTFLDRGKRLLRTPMTRWSIWTVFFRLIRANLIIGSSHRESNPPINHHVPQLAKIVPCGPAVIAGLQGTTGSARFLEVIRNFRYPAFEDRGIRGTVNHCARGQAYVAAAKRLIGAARHSADEATGRPKEVLDSLYTAGIFNTQLPLFVIIQACPSSGSSLSSRRY